MESFLFPDLSAVLADNCGCAKLSPGWSHPRRQLGSSVLIVGIKGQVGIADEGPSGRMIHDIGPGRVALLPAGRVHFGTETLAHPASYFWFHFSTKAAPRLLSEAEADPILSDVQIASHRLDGGALLPLGFSLVDPEPFWQTFRDLLYEQESPSYTKQTFQLLFQKLLIDLTSAVLASRRPEPQTVGPSSVAYSVVTWMCEHLTDPNLSIKSIAAAVGLNADYAGRRFREVMGVSVGTYLLRKRVELAIRQLQETNDPVETIARECGFASVRHFFRQFKSVHGLTPSEVRKRHRVMHVNAL